MKNRFFVFLVVVFVLLSMSCSRVASVSDTEKIDAKITRAIDSWRDPKLFDSCITGFKLLVDAIIIAAQSAEIPAEFGEKMLRAKKLFDSRSALDPEGFGLLNESYRLINSGKNFQMPGHLSKPDEMIEYACKKAEAAREYLKQGQNRECVKILLEIVIINVTPVKTVA